MKYYYLSLLLALSVSIKAQDVDASHYFEYHPEGTIMTVFEPEKFHGEKTVSIKGKAFRYTTENTEFGIDTNYYWDDDKFFYKYFPGLDMSDNFLPKKVHLDQEWTANSGKHKYHVAKTLENMEIIGANEEKITYNDVIHVIMSPVQEGLYVPYHFYYAKGVGLIKMVHETNTYELKIGQESENSN